MTQPSLIHVLQPKWRTALQRVRQERVSGGGGKLVILALVGGPFRLVPVAPHLPRRRADPKRRADGCRLGASRLVLQRPQFGGEVTWFAHG